MFEDSQDPEVQEGMPSATFPTNDVDEEEATVDPTPTAAPPTESDVAALKKAYPGASLYHAVPADNCSFVYRPLMFKERKSIDESRQYQQLLQNNPTAAEDWLHTQILQRCVVWPGSFNAARLELYPAGVAPALVGKILAASGYGAEQIPDVGVVEPSSSQEPTDEEIKDAKERYPDIARLGLYKKTIEAVYFNEGGELCTTAMGMFLYTAISRASWRQVADAFEGNPLAMDQEVVRRSVVWPKEYDWDGAPAGVVTSLAAAVMSASGFSRRGVDVRL